MIPNRRDALQLAAGLGLSFYLPGLDARAQERRGAERERSLIIVWLDGGSSQLETFDPHPGSPIGGETQAIATTIPDLSIASHFPQLAEHIHHLSVVRSLVSKEGDHARAVHMVRTGYRPDTTLRHPSLGSIVAHELPASGLDLPAFVSLGYNQFPSRGGYLGGRFDAFLVQDPSDATRAEAVQQQSRQSRRMAALNVAARSFERGREAAVRGTLYRDSLESALRMMSSEQLCAFDLSQEPESVRNAYGTDEVGRGCLAARRLIEAGVRVVEVTHLNYDGHEDNFNLHRRLAGQLDPALASLLRDLNERDLLSSTAVLVLSEFGRTPKINPKEGRDHWPTGFSCLVGGAGLAAGRVIGATDPTGTEKDPQRPVEIAALFATILTTLGVDPHKPILTPIGRPMKLADAAVVEELLGG